MSQTAPKQALDKYARWQFCREYGWTFAEYDAARASDILLAREFGKIQQAAEKKATEKLERENAEKAKPHA